MVTAPEAPQDSTPAQADPTLAKAREFRGRLVRRLAFGGWWSRRLALHDRLDPRVARQLGVQPAVLREAASLYRSTYVFPGAKVTPLVPLDVELPVPIFAELALRAKLLRMMPGQMVRATLHASMRLQREPAPRAPPGTRAGRKRIRGIAFGGRILTVPGDGRRHICTTVSRGLYAALEQRAAARRISRARYVQLWLADLAEGLLDDVAIVPVEIGAMFDDERAYFHSSHPNRKIGVRRRLRVRREPPHSDEQWGKIPRGFEHKRRKRAARPPSVVAFAREIVEALVPWAAGQGEPSDRMAEELGVTRQALRAARRLWPSGRRTALRSDQGPRLVELHVDVREEIVSMVPGGGLVLSSLPDLIRGLLHAVMQTPREPTRRPAHVRSAEPGYTVYAGEPANPAANVIINKTKRHHVRSSLSAALDRAMRERAAAYGVTPTRYVVLWIMDCFDGYVDDLPIVPMSGPDLLFQPAHYLHLPLPET